jgi:hypothetical protein
MNNAEVQHIFNLGSITEAVEAAINGWIVKNPNATSEQIREKRADIATNITEARTKDKFLNSKANRTARRAHIAEEVAKHGLAFLTAKDLTTVDDIFVMPEEAYRKTPLIAEFFEELINSIGLKKDVERAVTFCYKTEDIGYSHTGVKLSMAFQNPADEPDALIAREYALARFLEGKIVEVAAPNLLLEKFGLNNFIRECLNTDIPVQYAAKHL